MLATLRNYQETAVSNTLSDIRSGAVKSSALVLPTSGGKTITAASILDQFLLESTDSEKIIWVAHREELIKQALDTLNGVGLHATEWTAKTKDLSGKIIVASIQSCRTLPETLRNASKYCGLLVIDEAHHRAAQSYKTLEENIKPGYVLGLTATPIRMDDLPLNFDKISFEISFLELVAAGYICKPVYISYITGLDYKLRSTEGDFSNEDLRTLDNDIRNSMIAKDFADHRNEYGKTMVFCVSVDHCYKLAKAIQTAAPGTITAVVHGNMDSSERHDIVQAFKNGVIDVILNVEIFTEGTDIPSIQTVILTRPTKSEARWAQMVGRGARIFPGKTHFNIVDFVDSGNKYAIFAEDWSMRLLGADPNPQLQAQRQEQIPIDAFNSWLKDMGSTRKVKSKREVLEIDGILILRSKNGTKRMIVQKKHKSHLDNLVNHVMKNPPNKNVDVQAYINNYANRYDKSLFKWPGKHWLTSIAWSVYFRFGLHKTDPKGLPTFEYVQVPEFE